MPYLENPKRHRPADRHAHTHHAQRHSESTGCSVEQHEPPRTGEDGRTIIAVFEVKKEIPVRNLEEQTMNYFRQHARLVFLGILCLVIVASIVKRSTATIGSINKADLSGPWQVTLIDSMPGCGISTERVNFTLNSSGLSTNATTVTHGSVCGDFTSTGTFTITSLSSNGSGTAHLTVCTNPGCEFTFSIQVSPDRSVFNLVDITDPGNFWEGVAIHQ